MTSERPNRRSRPGSEPGPENRSEPGPGVSHRTISWRSSRLVAPKPVLHLPKWVDRLVLGLLIGYLLAGIAAAPLSLEETVQESLAAGTGALVTDPISVLPSSTTTPTLDSVRLAYGSLTRYAAAAGWYLAGGRQTDRPIDLTLPGPPAIALPADPWRIAARVGPALVAALGVLLVYRLGRRLAGRSAGLVAAVALALHPTFLSSGRQAVDAGLTLTLGLASVLVAARLCDTLATGDDDPGLGAWTGLAVLAGLTLAAGPTAPAYLAGAVAFVGAGLVGRQRRRRAHPVSPDPVSRADPVSRTDPVRRADPVNRAHPGSRPDPVSPMAAAVGWSAATMLGALVVWVVVSPSLWGWLPERLSTRHDQRALLAAQQLLPDPGSPSVFSSILGVLTHPFLTPLSPDPGLAPGDTGYLTSWWAGLPLGTTQSPLPGPLAAGVGLVVGVVLTVGAVAGLVLMWRSKNGTRWSAAVLTAWLAAVALWLVLWPSRQPDSALPLIALAAVLAGTVVPPAVGLALERAELRRT